VTEANMPTTTVPSHSIPARDVAPTVVLLNLFHGGHNPQHLECLVREWELRSPLGRLHLVISETAANQYPDLVELTDSVANVALHRVATPPGFASDAGIFGREPLHRRVARHYARLLHADRLMFMYLDAAQLSLTFDLRFSWPLELSGIYFRPSFHYGRLGGRQTRRGRLMALGKQLSIRAAMRNPHLRTLFCLDPIATTQLAEWARHTECVFLPEPLWDPSPRDGTSRLARRLEPGRRRLVLFGSLDERKGVHTVLDALQALPEATQRKLGLILAGRLSDSERPRLRVHIGSLEKQSAVQVILADEHLPEDEVQPLLRESDLVLVTYVRHVGSSGLLVRAAAAGVPVLASDYGLVGAHVRKHRLGLTVDSTSSQAVADAIASWIERPDAFGFDPGSAERFALANTAEAFAETILSRLLAPTSLRHAPGPS
jgi:glycosyltransferase involved in cell wall biosynthesis